MFASNAPENLKDFFWEQLESDAEKIKKLNLLNSEEFFIVMHTILQNILENTDSSINILIEKLSHILSFLLIQYLFHRQNGL